MKLIYRITFRLSLVAALLLAGWAVFFYYALLEEINDEADDALEDYSELIIVHALAGRPLPDRTAGSNNSYSIVPVTEEYAATHTNIRYYDADVYIPEKEETEPARFLKTIYRDGEGAYYELTVATPTFEKKDLRASVLGWIVFLYVMLLLTVVAVTVWVFYRSMRPLYALLRWLDDYRVGHSQPLVSGTKVTEFRKLNDAAVRAAARADRLFERQKEFIGNASHELQTPLAVCRNRLEWLVDNTSLTEEQTGEVFQTIRTLDRISKLNQTLLLLTKIDNGQFAAEGPVDFNALLKEQLQMCDEIYSARKINYAVVRDEPFVAPVNEMLAVTIVGNIVKNAYVHTPQEGLIEVEIFPTGFCVSNTAAGGPLDGVRIFERFYRGDSKEGTAGLGLALVDAACRRSGLRAGYEYRGGRHVFRITLE